MGKRIDLIGQRFGRLVVLSVSEFRNKKLYWLCKCDCGRKKEIIGRSLRYNHTRSCGCLWLGNNNVDLNGHIFGKLFVKHLAEEGPRGRKKYLCVCTCGTEIKLDGKQLIIGNNKSCGNGKCREMPTKHGLADKCPEYIVWLNIKKRCNKKEDRSFLNYGGRGIKICKEWEHDFERFYRDMGERPSKKHSIDRIDNDKSYCMENCRWATRSHQMINRRNFKESLSKYKGVCFHKVVNKWQARIQKDGSRQTVGFYETEIDAAKAYNKKAIELYGEFAKLNVIPSEK